MEKMEFGGSEGAEPAESASDTTAGLGKVQIKHYFSLKKPDPSTKMATYQQTHNIKPDPDEEIEIICHDDQFESRAPIPIIDAAVKFYMHPVEKLYVCRQCQKRFPLKLMVKVHTCPQTHCASCELVLDSCQCQYDSLMDTDLDVDMTVSSGVSLRSTPSHSQNMDEGICPEETAAPNGQAEDLSSDQMCVNDSITWLDGVRSDTVTPLLPTIISTVSLAQPGDANILTASQGCRTKMSHAVNNEAVPAQDSDPDSDSEQRLMSCSHCSNSFFTEQHLEAHIKKYHPKESGVEVIQLQNIELSQLPVKAHTDTDVEDHLKCNIVRVVDTVLQHLESSHGKIDHIDVKCEPIDSPTRAAVSSPASPTTPRTAPGQSEHTHCRTCGTKFRDIKAYTVHTGTCFKVWSHPSAGAIPLQPSVDTRPHTDKVNILRKPKHRKYTHRVNDFNKVVHTPLKWKPVVACVNGNDSKVKSEIKSDCSNIISESDMNQKSDNLVPDSQCNSTVAHDSDMAFPQPIKVTPVIKIEHSEEPEQLSTHFSDSGLQVSIKAEPGASTPCSRSPQRPTGGITRGQLLQLTMEPRVTLIRCDALPNRIAALQHMIGVRPSASHVTLTYVGRPPTYILQHLDHG